LETTSRVDDRLWWARPGLEVRDGRLTIAGRDAVVLAREHGTPLYVTDLARVGEQATALHDALEAVSLEPRIRLALKAQRDPALLAYLRRHAPFVGLDVCSPGEVRHSLEHGWAPSEISYTGTNMSDRDLAAIVGVGVHLNVDLLSQLRRAARHLGPGAHLGIRVNPGIGASFGGGVATFYTGEHPTKFGIFAEQLPEAVEIVRRHDLVLDTVHFHVGDGYLTEELEVFEETVRRVAEMVIRLRELGCHISEVNTGGGLGVPQRAGDEPLDLGRWAGILARHLEPLGVVVGTEPGDFLVK
jgi:diaminopimelate decarboxylase